MDITPNDATAIMDMLARHAADDTQWDEPPLLFALGRTPEGAYGIAPARPWTKVMLQAHQDHRLPDVLEAFPDMMERWDQHAPGVDPAWVALRVAFEDGPSRPWFPDIAEGTEPCGIALRVEAWAKSTPVEVEQVNPADFPPGRLADDLDAVEVLSWLAVTYDEQFCNVSWRRGEAAPMFDTWSFKSDFYQEHKNKQRMATALRAMMRMSRRTFLANQRRGEPTSI